MRFFSEFKAFAMRGNVIDMAVGIIIGAAFGRIVNSLVTDVMMPPLGLMAGEADFSHRKLVLRKAVHTADGLAAVPEVAVNYGLFINATINFVIVAFAVYLLVRTVNALKRREDVKPPALTRQEVLLTEIRDALKVRGST